MVPRVFRANRLTEHAIDVTTRFAAQVRVAQDAERAKLDAVFMTDFPGLDRTLVAMKPISPFEPMTYLAAMAAVTHRLGLIGTMSTLFNYPFNITRQFSSLEHISGGRSGWNLVTSFKNEGCFGFDSLPAPAERYAAAQETLDICKELWGSWAPDAVVADRERAVYADVEKIRDVDFVGDHHRFTGGLDSPRSPQGRPVVFQAGASEEGLDFAARNAEVIFSGQPLYDYAKEYRDKLGNAVQAHGRAPKDVLVVAGLQVYVGETEEKAWERARSATFTPADRLDQNILSDLRGEIPGFTFKGLDLDAPVPPDLFPSIEDIRAGKGRRSRTESYRRLALDYSPTLRHFLDFIAVSGVHTAFVGTVNQVADEMEHWFKTGVCEGFAFIGGDTVAELDATLLPELRRRGLFRSEYDGATLREHLRLAL